MSSCDAIKLESGSSPQIHPTELSPLPTKTKISGKVSTKGSKRKRGEDESAKPAKPAKAAKTTKVSEPDRKILVAVDLWVDS